MTTNSADNSLYIMGGMLAATNGADNALYRYDLGICAIVVCLLMFVVKSTWSLVNASGAIPSRYDHTAVLYKNCIWIFGGCSGSTYHNDMYKVNQTIRQLIPFSSIWKHPVGQKLLTKEGLLLQGADILPLCGITG